MSNKPNRAGKPAGKTTRRKETTLDLTTARQMLPLVRSIVSEIAAARTALNRLMPEHERLNRQRRDLVWQERQRRYQVGEEVVTAEKGISTAEGELNSLGLKLIDGDTGEVDFPTRVNGRSAAFTWKLGEGRLSHWHYTGEEQRRPIPADWELASLAPAHS